MSNARYETYEPPFEPPFEPSRERPPLYAEPTYALPTYETPVYETPSPAAPLHEAPTYAAPGYGAPTYDVPPAAEPWRAAPYEATLLDVGAGVDADATIAVTVPDGSADEDAPGQRFPRQSGTPAAPAAPGRAERRRRAAGGRGVPVAPERGGTPRPPEAMRKLVPQALVVAFLAGGTSAFVANDKAVQLIVDGKPRTLHTFADDVGELLADEGVDVGTHDIVAPASTTALASGDEIAVRYGRPVHLTLDGQRRKVWTTAHTVDGALRQLGVRAEGAQLSASRSRRIDRDGLALDVLTERTVTIMADGRERTIRTNASSVRDAVAEAGVTLRGQDTTSVAPESFPRDGQTVTVMRVTGTKEVREEPIPFEVERTEDATVLRGTEVVAQAGRPGVRRVTYTVRSVNGVKQKPRRVRTEVVREPQKRIVKVGTKQMPSSVAGADGLNWSGLAHCESGGRPGAVDPSGTYGGLYQFDTRTWQALGGSGRPQDASASEQTFRAKKLYVQRGASPWPHCGRRL